MALLVFVKACIVVHDLFVWSVNRCLDVLMSGNTKKNSFYRKIPITTCSSLGVSDPFERLQATHISVITSIYISGVNSVDICKCVGEVEGEKTVPSQTSRCSCVEGEVTA